MNAVEVIISILKSAAALARALGVGDGAIHSAVLRPEEAAAIDLEVDALEEAKLLALERSSSGGGP